MSKDHTNGWNKGTFDKITEIQQKQEGKVMNGFIMSTAKDYDMEYNQVETIYNVYYKIGDSTRFYQELENFIKNRSEND